MTCKMFTVHWPEIHFPPYPLAKLNVNIENIDGNSILKDSGRTWAAHFYDLFSKTTLFNDIL